MAELSEVTIVTFSIHHNFIELNSLAVHPAHYQRVAPAMIKISSIKLTGITHEGNTPFFHLHMFIHSRATQGA